MKNARPGFWQRWQQRLPVHTRRYGARFAKLGFWFFFLKGMLWLIVPVLLAWWATEGKAQAVQILPTLPVTAEARREALRPADPPPPVEMPVLLDTVVVTGTRTPQRLKNAPVEVQVISAAQIQDSGARDVAELLEREGGVTVSRVAGRGTRIEVQGLSSEHVLILVDGRRVIGRINGAVDLTRLRAANIQRVEIVKGPSSALYGSDALGGVVNIITKAGGKGAFVTARGDSGNNTEGFGGWAYEHGDSAGTLHGGVTFSESYDLNPQTPAEDGSSSLSRFANASHTQRFGDNIQLRANLDYALDDTQRVDAGSAVFDISKRIEEIRLGLAPQFQLGDNRSLLLDASYSRYYDQFLQDQRGANDNDRYERTVDQLYATSAQYNHRIGRHALTAGLEAQFERLEADRLSSSGERDRQSIFLQDQFTLLEGDALTFVPGLRYDRDSQFGSATSPKLALRYNITPDFFLRLGAGQGYRAPDFKQLLLQFSNPAVGYVVEGNPKLKPERSTGFNLGATWYQSGNLNLGGNAYHNRVQNLIEIVQTTTGNPSPGNPVRFTYVNVARARLSGLDLQGEWRPALGDHKPLTLRLGYGFLHSEDADSGQPLSGRARHRANADLGWRTPGYELGLRGVWTGKRVFQTELDTGGAPTGAGQANPYFLFDTRAQWKGWPAADLTLGVSNLFNAGDSRFLPIAPRAVFLELRKDFK